MFAGLDYARWADDPAFGETEARAPARRRRGGRARASRSGSCSGSGRATRAGALVPVDDPRLDPLWAAAGELGVPVTIHVADPIAFFEPARRARTSAGRSSATTPTGTSGRRARAAGPTLDGFPPFDELIDGLEAVVARHPGTTFIGAHVGCAAEDLARVSAILERCPNFNVDIAARIAELGRQPYTARAFIERWSDRVLFGTDMAPDAALVGRLLPLPRDAPTSRSPTTPIPDESPTRAAGGSTASACPTTSSARVYRENALRLIRF